MKNSHLKDLKKQDKYTKFFLDWAKQEFKNKTEGNKLLEDLEVLSKHIGITEGLIIACFDYRNLALAFFAGNIEGLTGYPPEMFRKKGMETSFTMVHPDDRPELFRFQKIVLENFHQLSLSERNTFEFSYTARWVHRDTGEVIWMLSRARPYFIDEKGNFAMDLHIIVQLLNPPKIKEYDWNFAYTKDDGSRIFVSKHQPETREISLTKKEKEIVKLMLEGKESKEIGVYLNISVNTVATHRKNILKKVGAHNVGELINILASYHF
jgi:DNA-binding CsgD family transcriptional regulator